MPFSKISAYDLFPAPRGSAHFHESVEVKAAHVEAYPGIDIVSFTLAHDTTLVDFSAILSLYSLPAYSRFY